MLRACRELSMHLPSCSSVLPPLLLVLASLHWGSGMISERSTSWSLERCRFADRRSYFDLEEAVPDEGGGSSSALDDRCAFHRLW